MGLLTDLRFAARVLFKDRWFTALAVVALALGIGVNNTVFTFVNAVLLRGLPFEDSRSIMHLSSQNLAEGQENLGVSYPDYEDWRAAARSFSDLGAFTGGTMNVSDGKRPPERTSGAWVSANTFRLIGQRPLLGRDFAADEDLPGAEPVVLLGHGLWTSRYGADPNLLGRTVRVNEVPSTVIGVMPEGMKFPFDADMWQPLTGGDDRAKRDRRNLGVFGRLRQGAGLSEARAEMSAIAARLAEQYPDTNLGVDAVVMPYNDRFNGGEIKLVFLALMGAVAFVLLIACANVANLLLARSAYRAREIAVRSAIGASRWHVVRQLLVESVLMGILSGVIGFVLSLAGVRLFAKAVEDVGKPYWIQFTMDAPVFGFLLAVAVGTGIVFGLAPALQASKLDVNATLQAGGRSGGASAGARRFTRAMVVVQLALTVVLLFGAALMIRSFFKLYAIDLGVRTEGLLTMRLGLAERKYPEPDDRFAFHERLGELLAAVPGVESAAIASHLPLGGGDRRELLLEGRPLPLEERAPEVSVLVVSPEYFETLALPIRYGRSFRRTDGATGAEAAILNERAVERFSGRDDPLARRIRLREEGREGPWISVVGVAPSVRQRNVQEVESDAVVYLPLRQEPLTFVDILARGRGDPAALASEIREVVRQVDPDQPVYRVRTLDEALAARRWPFRVFGTLFTIFALVALLIAAVGVYAVMAYAVSRRTQEIGMRMALGASARSVAWLVVRQGIGELVVGMALGITGALLAGRVLSSLLVQVAPSDPLALGSITLLLVAVASAACLWPARRASRVDPMVALRTG